MEETLAALHQRVDELEEANKTLARHVAQIETKLGIRQHGIRVAPWMEISALT